MKLEIQTDNPSTTHWAVTYTFDNPITKITVNGEEWVPRIYPDLMECSHCGWEWREPSKLQFKVGDFVRVKEMHSSPRKRGPLCNETGKVMYTIPSGDVGVEFPGFKDGHNLGSRITGYHGWYFPPSHLELI